MTPRRRRILLALTVLAAAALYIPNLSHPFQYDDEVKIESNPQLARPLDYFRAFFRKEGYSEDKTRLIPNLTYCMDYALYGRNPTGYNTTNLLIHLCVIWLIVRFGRVVLRRLGQKDSFLPLLAAAIFALHPLNSEAANYGNARPNVMCTAFYLAAIPCFFRAMSPSGRRKRRRRAALAAALAGTLLSKELGVTVVATAPLLWLWIGAGGEQRKRWRWSTGGLLLAGAGALLATGALSGVLYSLDIGRTMSGNAALHLLLTVLGQSQALMAYFGMALLPLPRFLNVGHDLRHPSWNIYTNHEPAAQVLAVPLLCFAVLAGAVAAAFLLRRRSPFASFHLLWPFLAHAPTSLFPRGEQMVEYRTYLPMAGICLLLAWLLAKLPRRLPAALVLLAALAGGTLARNPVWRTRLGMWEDVVRKSPHQPRAHHYFGMELWKQGKGDEAFAHAAEALRLSPEFPDAHNLMGTLLLEREKHEEALAHFSEAIRIRPKHPVAWNNKGMVLAKQGKNEEARRCYAVALELQPEFAEAHNNLGALAISEGKRAEAILRYREALRLKPDFADAHNNLAVVLAEEGSLEEALAHFSEALRRKPSDARIYLDRGVVLGRAGRNAEAADSFSEALRLDPSNAEAHNTLGGMQGRQGRLEEAVAHLKEALRLKPDYAEAHRNLGLLLARQGKPEEAAARYAEALRLKPDYVEAHYDLGILLGKMERFQESRSHFKEVLRLKPGIAEAHSDLAMVLVKLGKTDEAVSHFQEALRLKPDLAVARDGLSRLLEALRARPK